MDLAVSALHCNSLRQNCMAAAAFSRTYPSERKKKGWFVVVRLTTVGWYRLILIYISLAAIVLAVFGQTAGLVS